ncbi:MAG: hypothetical protein Kow0042_14370 [Calditrichia bacterium]
MAQSYDLKFVLVNDEATVGGNFDIKIQIKATGSTFQLGTSNLTFSYETSELSNPTLLTAHNFSGSDYLTMTVTEPLNGVTSVNIVLNNQENGTTVTTSYMDVATLRYQITTVDVSHDFTWRTGSPNRTNVWNDAATPQEITTGTLTNFEVIVANLKLFLEGPYSTSAHSMSTALKDNGYLPLSQPYSASPWSYSGSESVSSIPDDVVDWVLVELRSDLTTTVGTRAGFVKSDGTVVDLDGSSALKFESLSAGNYYVVVHHRNHFSIMSATMESISSSSSIYDFTTNSSQYYGGDAKQLETGVWGMYGGNADNSDQDAFPSDLALIKTGLLGGLFGYELADSDMDGDVFPSDYALSKINVLAGISSQVPSPY